MELVVLLVLALRLMTDEVQDGLATAGFHGLRPAHFFAFQLIGSSGGATGVQLAEHLGVTKQAASQMVEELDRLGYVDRALDPHDARIRRVVLTDLGRAVIAAAERLWAAQEDSWRARLGDDGLRAVRDGLRAVVEDRGGLEPPLRLRPTW